MKNAIRILALLALGAVALPALAQDTATSAKKDTPALNKDEIDSVLNSMARVVKDVAFVPGVDFSKWDKMVSDNRPALEKSKDSNEFAFKINGLLQKFGASHIVLNTPRGTEDMHTGKTVGIGFVPELVKEGIRVNDIFPDSPAKENGLEPGDIIVEANGKKPDNIFALRGEEGTQVTIKLKKATTGEVKTLTITRKAFAFSMPETLSWLSPDTAMVKVPSFLYYKSENIDKIMSEVDDKHAKTVVLDLRNNGGGYVWALIHLSGYFIPNEQPIGTFINRRSYNRYVTANKVDPKKLDLSAIATTEPSKLTASSKLHIFTGKVIVLVNEGTGSASEMMAAALQEIDKATVIGKKSAGAVLASTMAPLPGGYTLQYPFEDYVTIKGIRLEGHGVKPDYEAGTPRSRFEEDPGVKIAVKIASGEKP